MASDVRAASSLGRGAVQIVKAPVEFWLWLDPKSFIVRHQVERLGRIPALAVEPSADRLMFVRNPNFRGSISPLAGITSAYNVGGDARTRAPHTLPPVRFAARRWPSSSCEIVSPPAALP